MELNLLHLSDIHTPTGGDLYGQIDGIARVRTVRLRLIARCPEVEAGVVAGDIIGP